MILSGSVARSVASRAGVNAFGLTPLPGTDNEVVRFTLEVDLSDMAHPRDELGRILRYWAGAMKDLELAPGDKQDIYDSAYQRVGSWTVNADAE
jgi:hypothetical protein